MTSGIKNQHLYIPSLCLCGCGGIVWCGRQLRGNQYISGHNSKTKDSKERRSILLKGGISPFKGKHHTEASKLLLSKSKLGKPSPLKGIKRPDITGDKNKRFGEHVSEEQKKRQSEKMSGANHYNYGKHLSLKQRESISKANRGRVPSVNTGHIKGKRSHYDSPFQGTICFRSSYELLFAQYLERNGIVWFYELETFDLGNTTYTPDFFLPQFEKFVEIKGYMRQKAQHKINMFLQQYPFELEVLNKRKLIELGIKLC